MSNTIKIQYGSEIKIQQSWEKEQKDFIEYVTVTVFDLSEKQKELIKKGTRLLLEGKVVNNSYEKDGERVYSTSVIVSKFDITVLSVKQEGQQEKKEENDGIPF